MKLFVKHIITGKGFIGVVASLLVWSSLLSCREYTYLNRKADEQFGLYNYSTSKQWYEKAYSEKPDYKSCKGIALSAYKMRDYTGARQWYQTLLGYDQANAEDKLTYTEVLMQLGEYKYALDVLQLLDGKTGDDVLNKKAAILSKSCDSVLSWAKDTAANAKVALTDFNSKYSDFGAVLVDGKIVFASDRLSSKSIIKKNKRPFLTFRDVKGSSASDIYGWTGNAFYKLYDVAGTSDNFANVSDVAGDLNNIGYHVSSLCLFKNGNEAFFAGTPKAREKAVNKKDIYKTIHVDLYKTVIDRLTGKWSAPVMLSFCSPTEYSVGDPFISSDGKLLLFASDMPNGYGGVDIYYATRKHSSDEWSKPRNFGKMINSPYDDRTPFITDDSVLYFASNGHDSYGGLDVFKAVFSNGVWKVTNMKAPINSPQDDFAFWFKDKESGFFTSNRLSGIGSDDIYSFDLKYEKAPVLRICVISYKDKSPLRNAMVRLALSGKDGVQAMTDEKGCVEFPIANERNPYSLNVTMDGYLTISDEIHVERLKAEPDPDLYRKLYSVNVQMAESVEVVAKQEPKVGEAVKLENVFFDRGKYDVRADAVTELRKLEVFLKDHPSYIVEIASHTDNRGSDESNMILSQNRSNSIVKWLTQNGIDRNRLVPEGYGELKPVIQCPKPTDCSEKEHQMNRRSEFIVLSK